MRALTDEREALVGEVLGPEVPTPASVYNPRVVGRFENPARDTLGLILADGGRWEFSQLVLMAHEDVYELGRAGMFDQMARCLFETRELVFSGRD